MEPSTISLIIAVAVFILIIVMFIVSLKSFKVAREEYKRTGKHPKGYYMGVGLGFGVALGIPLSVALGNISFTLVLGLPLGVVIGAGLEKRYAGELRPLSEREIAVRRRSIVWMFVILTALALLGAVAFMVA
jgi:hypothetical protein